MDNVYEVNGEISRRLVWAPLRVISILSGFSLLRGLASLILRYCLVFRRKAVVTMEKRALVLSEEWWILGKRIRTTTFQAPLDDMRAVRFENRQHYLYLLVGFGALAVGTWLGIKWFVDGLRASYPNLALLGAGVVFAGVLIDVLLYLFVPTGPGKKIIILSMGPWTLRLGGVDVDAAHRFLEEARRNWQAGSVGDR